MEIGEKEKVINNFKDTLLDLGETEEDLGTRRIFKLLHKFWTTLNLKFIASEILERHSPTTADHLSYLIPVGMQYVSNLAFSKAGVLKEDDLKILVFETINNHQKELIDICANNNVSTNIPNRYAPLSALINTHTNTPNVVELGSSFGLGIWSTRFPKIAYPEVVFSDEVFQRLSLNKPNKVHFTGLDTVDKSSYDPKWLKACLLSGYTDMEPTIDSLLKKMNSEDENLHGISFLTTNILNEHLFNNLPENQADLVWSSSTMYIFGDKPANAWNKIYPIARRMLKPNGWFVSADYVDWKDYSNKKNVYQVTCAKTSNWDERLVLCQSVAIDGKPKDACNIWKKGPDWDRIISSIKEGSTK